MENRFQRPVPQSEPRRQKINFPDLRKINHSYWFRLILTEGDSPATEIRYKVTVRFIESKTPTSALFLIDRAPDIYIDDRLPDLAVDMLAYKTCCVFYPLLGEIDTHMKWRSICNHEQIIRRWETIQPAVKRYFSGEEAKRYLNRMSESLASKESLEEIFREELFFQLYFRVLYANNASRAEEDVPFSFSVGNSALSRFIIEKQTLRPGKSSTVEVSQNGVEQGPQVWPGAGTDERNSYSANFVLDAQTNIIREVVAVWDFRLPVQRKVEVILFPLRQAASGIPLIEMEEVQEKNQKKGFFSRLFGE